MARWLVRFGYVGTGYSGWARQPGLRTIEGELLSGVARVGLAPKGEAVRLEVASRTDRGVSARGNALALTSDLEPATLLHRLNAITAEVFFAAAVRVPADFRVRQAERRIYRYFDPTPARNPRQLARAAAVLCGPVDARSFGRGIPPGVPRWVPLEVVRVSALRGGRVIEVRARSFVWGMVRKIVGALREVDAGRMTLASLEDAARGRARFTLPMAEPEGLVLWDVQYPLRWTARWDGPDRYQRVFWRASSADLWRRQHVLGGLMTGRSTPPP